MPLATHPLCACASQAAQELGFARAPTLATTPAAPAAPDPMLDPELAAAQWDELVRNGVVEDLETDGETAEGDVSWENMSGPVDPAASPKSPKTGKTDCASPMSPIPQSPKACFVGDADLWPRRRGGGVRACD